MPQLSNFIYDEAGATSIEYALVAVIVSIAIISVLGDIANNLNSIFNKTASGINSK